MEKGETKLGVPVDEEKWAAAKKRAADEGQAENYAYITAIYKKMMHLEKALIHEGDKADEDFQRAFWEFYSKEGLNRAPKLEGWPRGLDTENIDIRAFEPGCVVLTAGGDWQDPVNVELVLKGKKLVCGHLFNGIENYHKKKDSEVHDYLAGLQAKFGAPMQKAIGVHKALPAKPEDLDKTNAHKTAPKGYPSDKSQYGDPNEFKYPLDTEEHVHAALSYFSKPENHGMYSPDQRRSIWGRIVAAAKRMGIDVQEKNKFEKAIDTLVGLFKSETWSGHKLQGRTKVHGMDVSIENKKGSTRKGVDKDGHEWATEMHADYGYIKGTVGKDKDHLDVYLGPNPESRRVFIVHQNDPVTGKYDEDKCMIGWDKPEDAKAAYEKQYDRPGFFGTMDEADVDDFKAKVFSPEWKGKRVPGTRVGVHAGA